MGSMYMARTFLEHGGEGLLTGSCLKYWVVPEVQSAPEDHEAENSSKSAPGQNQPTLSPTDPGSHLSIGLCDVRETTNLADIIGPSTSDDVVVHICDTNAANTSAHFAKIDIETLRKLGWSSSYACVTPERIRHGGIRCQTAAPRNAATVLVRRGSHDESNESENTRLTKVELRRLTEQVREVGSIIKDKFKGKQRGEKLYRLTSATAPDPATQALRNELQASRLPFQPRRWRPLKSEDVSEPTVVRCRLVGSRPKTANGFYGAASAPGHLTRVASNTSATTLNPATTITTLPVASLQARPRSSPAPGDRLPRGGLFSSRPPSGLRRPETPRVEPGEFDSLTPAVLSQLLRDVTPRPASACYGDRVLAAGADKPRRGARKDKRPASSPRAESLDLTAASLGILDDVSTTSGIESGDVDLDDVSDLEDEDVMDDDDDDDSDSERGGFEPSLEEARRQMRHPSDLLRLRPEKMDAIYIPENKRDMRRFDFDAETVDVPPYDFKCPMPEPLDSLDLRQCAKDGSDWKGCLLSKPTGAVPLQALVDRLVEMERYQLLTEEWESKKLRSLARRQERALLNSATSSSSLNGSVGTSRPRDRRCCGLCLQAACVGDCPEKRPRLQEGRCERCLQPLCTGACQDSQYEQRMRQARSSDSLVLEERPPSQPPPRSPSRGCHSCLRRHNAKLINANSLLLGRPRSSLATYARGKASARPPRDLRPASALSLHSALLRDFERLGIEPQQPALPKSSGASRSRSRSGLLPGKSARSNRKTSLTDSGRRRKSRSRSLRSAHSGS